MRIDTALMECLEVKLDWISERRQILFLVVTSKNANDSVTHPDIFKWCLNKL